MNRYKPFFSLREMSYDIPRMRNPKKWTKDTQVKDPITGNEDTNATIDNQLANLRDPDVQATLAVQDLKISTHTGKMVDVPSLSFDPARSKRCTMLSKNPKNVCYYCYSIKAIEGAKRSTKPSRKANSIIMTKMLYKVENIPDWGNHAYMYFRINADGDFIDATHYKNVFRFIIAKYLAGEITKGVSIFTKNKALVAKYGKFELAEYGVPDDFVQLVYSEPLLNPKKLTCPPGFDKVFGVYTRATVKEQGIKINCQKKCKDCFMCYKPGNEEIKELIKTEPKDGQGA